MRPEVTRNVAAGSVPLSVIGGSPGRCLESSTANTVREPIDSLRASFTRALVLPSGTASKLVT